MERSVSPSIELCHLYLKYRRTVLTYDIVPMVLTRQGAYRRVVLVANAHSTYLPPAFDHSIASAFDIRIGPVGGK